MSTNPTPSDRSRGRRVKKVTPPQPRRKNTTWRDVRVNVSSVLLSFVVVMVSGVAAATPVALDLEPLAVLPVAVGVVVAHRGMRLEHHVGRITSHGWSALSVADSEYGKISVLAQRHSPQLWDEIRVDLDQLHQELREQVILEGDISHDVVRALTPGEFSRSLLYLRAGVERALEENREKVAAGEAAARRIEEIWREFQALRAGLEELERDAALPLPRVLPGSTLVTHTDRVRGLAAGHREVLGS